MFKWFSYGAAELKSPREVGLMREAGKLVAHALRIVRRMAKPGVRTIEIDRAVEDFFHSHNAVPLFKGYPGQKVPFPASTCLSVNEQVVHGIPGQRVLRDGDLFKIDTACKLNGWCADAAATLIIGNVRPEWRRLVQVAEEVLQRLERHRPRARVRRSRRGAPGCLGCDATTARSTCRAVVHSV